MKNRSQSGLTLIELLVAAALGLLLLGIVITIYLGAKNTFRAAEGVARSQEATRFAMHFLKQDTLKAGFQDCSGGVSSSKPSGISTRSYLDDSNAAFPPSIENAIFGWEFSGTDINDNYELDYEDIEAEFTQADVESARTSNTAASTEWSGNYIQGFPGTATVLNLPDLLADLEPMSGSDIFAVNVSTPVTGVYPSEVINQRQPFINTVDSDGNSTASGIENGRIIKVGDCSAVETFQNYATENDDNILLNPLSGSLDPGNTLNGNFQWQKKWGPEATIYRTETKVFYVGTGSGGLPSLFEYTTECGFADNCGAVQSELVEGVENMQILYGEDLSGPDGKLDGIADRFLSADDVVDFNDIIAVKISLLVRSPGNGTDAPRDESYMLHGAIEVEPPTDRYQRFVNSVTVNLQSKGL